MTTNKSIYLFENFNKNAHGTFINELEKTSIIVPWKLDYRLHDKRFSNLVTYLIDELKQALKQACIKLPQQRFLEKLYFTLLSNPSCAIAVFNYKNSLPISEYELRSIFEQMESLHHIYLLAERYEDSGRVANLAAFPTLLGNPDNALIDIFLEAEKKKYEEAKELSDWYYRNR